MSGSTSSRSNEVEHVAGPPDPRACTTISRWAISTASSRRPIAPAIGRSWTCSKTIPEIPFALHTSGPLLEWLVDRHPEYIARVRGAWSKSGRVEILGGGFFEPILTMIPAPGPGRPDPGFSRLS